MNLVLHPKNWGFQPIAVRFYDPRAPWISNCPQSEACPQAGGYIVVLVYDQLPERRQGYPLGCDLYTHITCKSGADTDPATSHISG